MDLMRVSAKVDLDAILKNIKEIKDRCREQKIYAVLKADGYGHGGLEIARALEQCDMIYGYAVATAEEAFELRDNGLKKPILILGYTFKDSLLEKIEFSGKETSVGESAFENCGNVYIERIPNE